MFGPVVSIFVFVFVFKVQGQHFGAAEGSVRAHLSFILTLVQSFSSAGAFSSAEVFFVLT